MAQINDSVTYMRRGEGPDGADYTMQPATIAALHEDNLADLDVEGTRIMLVPFGRDPLIVRRSHCWHTLESEPPQ